MSDQSGKIKFDPRHKSNMLSGAIIIASILLTACGGSSSNETPDNSSQASSTAETSSGADTDSNTNTSTNDNDTNSDANPDAETPTDDDSEVVVNSGPPAPVDLIGVVYTESELEVFWKAPIGSNGITYNVTVNGELVDTVDAKSYYMNNLAPATTFDIDVQSLDAAGTKGQTASISLTTREASATITAGNAMDILEYVVSIANEKEFADFIDILHKVNGPSWYEEGIERSDPATALQHGLEFTHLEEEYDFIPDLNYNCVAGGTARQNSIFGAQYSARGMNFSDCRSYLTNEQPLDGLVSSYWQLIKAVSNPGSNGENRFDNFTITGDDGRQRVLTAVLSKSPLKFSTYVWRSYGLVTPFSYTKQALEGQTAIHDLLVIRRSLSSGSTMPTFSAEFQVQAPETGNKLIRVETITDFNSTCSQGELKITTDDGSSMTMNAATDKASSFNLSINSEDVVIELEVDWNENNSFTHLLDDGDMTPVSVICN